MDRRPLTPPGQPASHFSDKVNANFGRHAHAYAQGAALQRALAWRLAHLMVHLPLPPGPAADLGAGSGLLSEALQEQGLVRSLVQLDLCAELLAHNRQAAHGQGRLWDLQAGLPPDLRGAALLCSSFALQWLHDPASQLQLWCHWLAPGGWLALTVPTAACFPEWRQAAERAAVPYTALPLPEADRLISVADAELDVHRLEQLRFSRADGDGRSALRAICSIGAGATPKPPLGPRRLRRLLQHWPNVATTTWEVLLLIGQRRP